MDFYVTRNRTKKHSRALMRVGRYGEPLSDCGVSLHLAKGEFPGVPVCGRCVGVVSDAAQRARTEADRLEPALGEMIREGVEDREGER